MSKEKEADQRLKLAIIVFGIGFGFLVLAGVGALLSSSAEKTDYQAWGWFYRLMNGDQEAAETMIQKLEEEFQDDLESEWPELEHPEYTPTLGPSEGFPDEPDNFYDNDQWQYE